MSAPRYYWLCLRIRWREALLCAILVLGVAVGWAFLWPATYTSTSQIQVNPYAASDAGARQAGLMLQNDTVSSLRSVASLATSEPVLQEVQIRMQDLQPEKDYTLRKLEKKIDAQPRSQSTLLGINATAKSPEEARDLASAATEALRYFAEEDRNQKSGQLLKELLLEEKKYKKRGLPTTEIRNRIDDLLALRVGENPLTSLIVPASLPYQADGVSKGFMLLVGAALAALLAFAAALFLEAPRQRKPVEH